VPGVICIEQALFFFDRRLYPNAGCRHECDPNFDQGPHETLSVHEKNVTSLISRTPLLLDTDQQRFRYRAGSSILQAAAVPGFSSAIGACGGFFIPMSYGISIALTDGPEAALYVFIVFYLSCIAMTGWYYARRQAEMPCCRQSSGNA
jgi:hypothetical protein